VLLARIDIPERGTVGTQRHFRAPRGPRPLTSSSAVRFARIDILERGTVCARRHSEARRRLRATTFSSAALSAHDDVLAAILARSATVVRAPAGDESAPHR
jgi:hypothetical protein